MRSHVWKRLVSAGLSAAVSLYAVVPALQAQSVPAQISLVVVEGESATTGVRQRVARDPVVRLEDDDHRPISGAAVVFALPVSGPSGEFMNGTKNLTAVTDENGLAVARGLKTNDIPGKLQIYATAAYRGLRARALITQMVEAAPGSAIIPAVQAPKSGGKWKWVVLGVAAAGGAGAGLYFGRNKSGQTPISISAGTVVFGSPR
jgi:hypothetical protein